MDGRDLLAKRLGISPRQARELLAPQCPGTWLWTKADIADAVREWNRAPRPTAAAGSRLARRAWRTLPAASKNGGEMARPQDGHEPI